MKTCYQKYLYYSALAQKAAVWHLRVPISIREWSKVRQLEIHKLLFNCANQEWVEQRKYMEAASSPGDKTS